MVSRRVDIEAAAHLMLADGVAHLRPEETVFEAMLDGWARQQASRLLSMIAAARPEREATASRPTRRQARDTRGCGTGNTGPR